MQPTKRENVLLMIATADIIFFFAFRLVLLQFLLLFSLVVSYHHFCVSLCCFVCYANHKIVHKSHSRNTDCFESVGSFVVRFVLDQLHLMYRFAIAMNFHLTCPFYSLLFATKHCILTSDTTTIVNRLLLGAHRI